MPRPRPKRVLVVVLGDLTRSPRMQNHCTSLARSNFEVSVFATDTCDSLSTSSNNIQQHHMAEAPDFGLCLPKFLAYILRPCWQALILAYHLLLISIPDVILVQNPPAIPTLPLLYFYSKLTRSKLIVDWHNYAYSILELKLGRRHMFVRMSKWLEIFFGRRSTAGFCVSKAMQLDLVRNNFRITYPVEVLYDKPPARFKPLSLDQKHDFFMRIKGEIASFRPLSTTPGQSKATRLTVEVDGHIRHQSDRPIMIISSTSWTEDEDFGLLLDALVKYNQMAGEEKNLPPLVVVITGKGPLKSHFENKIATLALQHVEFSLPWLRAADYPFMVGSADLGICLHTSSSGLDLPMKVVDMFGCGVPVLAHRFEAIGELLGEEGERGYTFDSVDTLVYKIIYHCKHPADLTRMRENIKQTFLRDNWEDTWSRVAEPVVRRLAAGKSRYSQPAPGGRRDN